MNKLNYAKLIVFLLRKEVELNSSRTHSNYLFLLTEMFYNVEKIINSYKNEPCQAIQTESVSSNEHGENEASYNNSINNSSKRLKTE